MTANAVTDDRKNKKPTAEQVDTYTRRKTKLGTQFLKGVLDINSVLDALKKLMEMRRGHINCDGQPEIPNWASRENPIVMHFPCGIWNPSKLMMASVFLQGEDYLNGEEYIVRAQKLNSGNGCAFDFYAKSENWEYLPKAKDGDVIVFPKTVFRNFRGHRCVESLYRDGSVLRGNHYQLDAKFGRHLRVAVLES